MKLVRIYYSGALAEGARINLTKASSHHLLQVLRLKIGENFIIFNGEGGEYLAELTGAAGKLAELSVLSYQSVERESPLNLSLAQGISRGERMDYVMQKSVELGVSEITPLFTQRCEVKLSQERLQKRLLHWQKIIIGACEQSGRLVIPTLNMPMQLNAYLTQPLAGVKLMCDPGGGDLLGPAEQPAHVNIMVGPEGGFTEEEVRAAQCHDFKRFALGPRVLRTETAAVVALSVAQSYWGDLMTMR